MPYFRKEETGIHNQYMDQSLEGNVFFSVIIPTFERPNDLNLALNGLRRSAQNCSYSFEVIFSDDSNNEDSLDMITNNFREVRWTRGKKIGPAGNRNSGAQISTGEWLIFIDDDCIPEPNFLKSYVKAIKENPSTNVFEGKISPDRERRTWAEGCPENSQGGMLWTSNLCINKNLFFEIGKFDERFKIAYEDVEFAYRLKQRKTKTVFVSDAAVCHPWRSLRSGGKNWKTKGYQIESLLLFLDKHSDAHKEYGSPSVYFKNFLRIISRNLFYCLFKLKGRGIDILISQAFISLKTTLILLK